MTTLPTIGAFLPVRTKDLERAELLLRSLRHFSHPLRTVQIACPRPDLAGVRALAGRYPELPIDVVSDDSILGPLLARLGRLSELIARDRCQMLLKLWAAASSEDPLLLILDADVILTRSLAAADLLSEGKPPLVTFAPVKHPAWYEASARLLSVRVAPHEMGVTPAILQREVARRLLEALDGRVARSAGARLCVTRQRWTEYALYYSWLAGHGLVQRFHRPVRYDAWFGPSVWHARDWPAWLFPSTDEQPGGPPFCVVQSAMKIPVAAILERVRRVAPGF